MLTPGTIGVDPHAVKRPVLHTDVRWRVDVYCQCLAGPEVSALCHCSFIIRSHVRQTSPACWNIGKAGPAAHSVLQQQGGACRRVLLQHQLTNNLSSTVT